MTEVKNNNDDLYEIDEDPTKDLKEVIKILQDQIGQKTTEMGELKKKHEKEQKFRQSEEKQTKLTLEDLKHSIEDLEEFIEVQKL